MTALKILVVDDDRDNADSLAELFELEGHDVATAYNGQEAIDIYTERDFDVAFHGRHDARQERRRELSRNSPQEARCDRLYDDRL